MILPRSSVAWSALITLALSSCGTLNKLPTATAITGIELGSGEILQTFSPTVTTYEASSLSTAVDTRIRVAGAVGHRYWLNGVEHTTNVWVKTRIPKIDKSEFITVALGDSSGKDGVYRIATQPHDFPEYKVKSNNPLAGQLFLNVWAPASDPKQSNYLLMLDEGGNPRYYLRSEESLADFKSVRSPTGEQRYIYHWADPSRAIPNGGEYRIMDQNFQLIKRVRLLPYGDHPVHPADLHDLIYLSDEHYIVLGYYPRKVNNFPGLLNQGVGVMSAVIQEVKDGHVVFEWESSNFPELYGDTTESQLFKVNGEVYDDYAHINSIFIDPKDQNIVASFRHLDSILKIDRQTGTIMWHLGGKNDEFGLDKWQPISHQHTASYSLDGHLTIFDNGNRFERSRVVDLLLDEKAKKVVSFQAYQPAARRFSAYAGSAQKLDALTYLIGWGGHPDSADQPDVTEVNMETGVPSFELFFPKDRYSYRAFKTLD